MSVRDNIGNKNRGESDQDTAALIRRLTDAFDPKNIASIHAANLSASHSFDDLPSPIFEFLERVSFNRRNQFLTGRYCAWQALAKKGCNDVTCLPIGENRLPCWPSGWLGSISHSGDIAIAMVANKKTVGLLGIDVQKIIPFSTYDEIHKLVARRDELKVLKDITPNQALSLIFSAKETLYKSLYPSIQKFLDFSAATLVSCSNQRLTLSLSQDWSQEWREGTCFEIPYFIKGGSAFTCLCTPSVSENKLIKHQRL